MENAVWGTKMNKTRTIRLRLMPDVGMLSGTGVTQLWKTFSDLILMAPLSLESLVTRLQHYSSAERGGLLCHWDVIISHCKCLMWQPPQKLATSPGFHKSNMLTCRFLSLYSLQVIYSIKKSRNMSKSPKSDVSPGFTCQHHPTFVTWCCMLPFWDIRDILRYVKKNCASPQPFIAFLRCSRPWSLGVACSPSQTPSIAIANPSFADSGIADITSIPIKIYKNYDFGYFGDFWNCFFHTFPHCIRCIITIWYDLYRFVSGPGSSGSMMELPHNPLLGGEATSGGWSCHWSLVVWKTRMECAPVDTLFKH